ncbi:transposase [Sphaerisporangium sp. TRM90804]|uniref:transposase n=1 Tax=Sphaerisporangium sp. TRM90804 TaxID=3031113 RepID=UPI00244A49D7|nr:transposase [Sphaerisporangium sp. TRM90804]MDH2426562.1 transposase [Sphaerisporangium sp. TRM90804]
MAKWVGPGRLEVRQVMLDGRRVFKVTRRGYLVEYCHSIHRLAELVDLADLVEVIELPER